MLISKRNFVGRILLPATSYIFLVWDTAAKFSNKRLEEVNVQMENIRFIRATTIDQDSDINLTVGIRQSDGYFEVYAKYIFVAIYASLYRNTVT